MDPIYNPEESYFKEWKKTMARFGDLNERVPVLFIMFPWPIYQGMDSGKPYPYYRFHDQVKNVMDAERIPYIDVTPDLVSRGNLRQFWVGPADFHLNEEAHRIVAGTVLPEIEKLVKNSSRL